MRDIKYYLPGTILIVMAIMIMAVPEILVALVAVFIVMAGIGALYLGHILRRSGMESRGLEELRFDDVTNTWGFTRIPEYKRWFRGL